MQKETVFASFIGRSSYSFGKEYDEAHQVLLVFPDRGVTSSFPPRRFCSDVLLLPQSLVLFKTVVAQQATRSNGQLFKPAAQSRLLFPLLFLREINCFLIFVKKCQRGRRSMQRRRRRSKS